MRDPNRIYPFCNKLAAFWMKYPDLRFGQLIAFIAKNRDPFYWEEEDFEKIMDKFEEVSSK